MNERPMDPAGDDEMDWDALARHLAGEDSPAEAAEFERWLHDDPARAALARSLSDAISRVAVPDTSDLDVEAALARTKQKLAASNEIPFRSPRRASRRPAFRVWPAAVRIAAGIVLLVGTVVLFRQLSPEAGPAVSVRSADHHLTATGELKEVLLEDGTRALLGPHSELVVPPGFGADHHSLSLSGEALFEVAAASAGLFTVHAGDAIIRDLGTAFTVNAGASRGVEVVVTAGSVSLNRVAQDPDAALVIRAGDRATVPLDGRITVEAGAASAEDLAWVDGEVVFREAKMDRVAEDLRRWYGIELRIADPRIAGRHLTASFAGESPEQIGLILALALGVGADVAGDTVTLRPGSNGE